MSTPSASGALLNKRDGGTLSQKVGGQTVEGDTQHHLLTARLTHRHVHTPTQTHTYTTEREGETEGGKQERGEGYQHYRRTPLGRNTN